MEAFYLTCQEFLRAVTNSPIVNILAYAALLYFVIHILHAVYIPFKLYVLAQYLPGVDLKKLGRWAVITGATDGIGREYANALARRGLDIVLISRTQAKLTRVAEEITTEYGVQVRTIAVDFSHTDIYSRIEKDLEGLDIAILVNNVGVITPARTFLMTGNVIKTTIDLLHVNCASVTNMSALVLPQMVEKGRGVIVNLSSIARHGFIGTATYSASKAYVSTISEMLQRTYRNTGVLIQTIEPGMVETPLIAPTFQEDAPSIPLMNIARKYTAISADIFAETSVNTIGWTESCNGNFIHYLVALLQQCQPKFSSQDSRILDQLPE